MNSHCAREVTSRAVLSPLSFSPVPACSGLQHNPTSLIHSFYYLPGPTRQKLVLCFSAYHHSFPLMAPTEESPHQTAKAYLGFGVRSMFLGFITSAMNFRNILSREFSAITRNINWIIFTVGNSRYEQGQHTEVTTTAPRGFRAFYKTTLLQHFRGELSLCATQPRLFLLESQCYAL